MQLLLLLLLLAGCDSGVKQGPALKEAEALAGRGLHVEAAQRLVPVLEEVQGAERATVLRRLAEYYHRGKVTGKAIRFAREAIRAGGENPSLLYVLGDSLRSVRSLKESQEVLERLVKAAPDHCRGKVALARMYLRSADPSRALSLFQACLDSRDVDRRMVRLEYGRALMVTRSYQEAADLFVELVVSNPFDKIAYSELAQSFYRLRRINEGKFVEQIYEAIAQNSFEEHVENRLRESGATGFALAQQGLNLTKQRRFFAAFNNFRRAIEFARTDPRVYIYYADVSMRFRRFKDAERTLMEAIDRGVQPASGLWMWRALVDLQRERYDTARQWSEKGLEALRKEGDQGGVEKGQASLFSLRLALGRCLMEARQLEAAQQALVRARRHAPKSWEPFYWLGRVLMARGAVNEAIPAFDNALRSGGQTYADLLLWRALAFEKAGNPAAAMLSLQTLQKQSPLHTKGLEALLRLQKSAGGSTESLARSYERAQQLGRKIAAVEEAIDTTPFADSGQHYVRLGQLYRQQGHSAAFDCFFLATDLLPGKSEPIKLLLDGMRQRTDIFLRLYFLRRILKIEPENVGALLEIASAYSRLRVRLEEAASFAKKAHAKEASAATYRVLGELLIQAGDRAGGLEFLEEGGRKFPADARLREALDRQKEPR